MVETMAALRRASLAQSPNALLRRVVAVLRLTARDVKKRPLSHMPHIAVPLLPTKSNMHGT